MSHKRLKIVHAITGLGVGGAEMMLYKLLSGMDRERFDNSVVSLIEVGPVAEKVEALGIRVSSLGMQPGRPTAKAVAGLTRLLTRERPDVLQTWMYHADLLGLAAGRMARVPKIVWNIRCSNIEEMSRMTAWTVKVSARLSRLPNAVVVNSEAGRRLHASLGYHPRRWVVIPNGFDLTRFAPDPAARESVRAELGLCPDAVLIGLIGRYDPVKGHKTFLEAASHLAKDYPCLHFVLAGYEVVPSNPELSRIIAGYGIEKSVHLLGERADMPRLMAAFDIAASSSYGEGFSNVIGEAMACEAPCVVTDVGDSALIVGGTGIVVPPRDASALARAWKRLIDAGPEARRELGKAARSRIEQNYSLERIVQEYEQLYLSLERA